ncbi:MAG TPA: hypothetical protein VMU14_00620 [Acidimicrobiales bacterium]|nr:hypothetical protein [Acidimicrobiales bacterium]
MTGALAAATAVAAAAAPAAASGWHLVHPHGARPAAAGTAHRVALFGDSLSDEAAAPFVFAAALDGYTAETHVGGGTAPCDWLPDLGSLVARPPAERPDVAVIEFTGNAFTSCMRPDGTTPAAGDILSAYARDAATYITTLQAAGVRPVFALAPAVDHLSLVPQVNDLWRQLAAEYPGVGVVDAGATVEGSGGAFTTALPCAPWEGAAQGCFLDRVIVRAPDGTHFCPTETQTVNGVVGLCPVPSPGAVRYAMGLAEALTRR